jgi:alpha-glucosidase
MMLLLTLRGTPTMYYGDELGLQNVPIPPEREQDPWGKGVPGLGRDGERTPMQWDGGPNAGFCNPDVQPWLPLAEDYRDCNVEAELQRDDSMLSLARRLLELRRSSRALSDGRYTPVPDAPSSCFVYTRQADGETCLIALNFTDGAEVLSLTGNSGTIAVSTHLDRSGVEDLARFELRPHEGCVIQLRDSP